MQDKTKVTQRCSKLKKMAFTLAEVIIVMGIIGIVAEMTIPTLVKNITNKQLEVAFLANYSILSQVSKQLIADNGGDLSNAYSTPTLMMSAIASKLKVQKTCPGASTIGDCWASKVANIDKSVSDLGGAANASYDWNHDTVVMNNGAVVMVNGSYYYSDCSQSGFFSGNGNKGVCAMVYIDVNGLKSPNILGRDVFAFYFANSSGILPDGYPGTDDYGGGDWGLCNPSGASVYNGLACGGRILVKGSMDY